MTSASLPTREEFHPSRQFSFEEQRELAELLEKSRLVTWNQWESFLRAINAPHNLINYHGQQVSLLAVDIITALHEAKNYYSLLRTCYEIANQPLEEADKEQIKQLMGAIYPQIGQELACEYDQRGGKTPQKYDIILYGHPADETWTQNVLMPQLLERGMRTFQASLNQINKPPQVSKDSPYVIFVFTRRLYVQLPWLGKLLNDGDFIEQRRKLYLLKPIDWAPARGIQDQIRGYHCPTIDPDQVEEEFPRLFVRMNRAPLAGNIILPDRFDQAVVQELFMGEEYHSGSHPASDLPEKQNVLAVFYYGGLAKEYERLAEELTQMADVPDVSMLMDFDAIGEIKDRLIHIKTNVEQTHQITEIGLRANPDHDLGKMSMAVITRLKKQVVATENILYRLDPRNISHGYQLKMQMKSMSSSLTDLHDRMEMLYSHFTNY